jgi:hypothetical protein
MRSMLVVVVFPVLLACGGSLQTTTSSWPVDGSVHVTVTRDDLHPTYRCEGQIQTRFGTAIFSCTAEGFDAWDVRGNAEQYMRPDVLRLWIHDADAAPGAGQPEIAIDLEPNAGRYSGWATVVLPDGTAMGHPGATAEAWVETP